MMLPGMSIAAGFDDPLEMLRACHERIQAQCATLEKLRLHMPEHGCDRAAQQAARAILRYFDTAGQLHHQDEEIDLFPLLVASGNVTAQQLVIHLLARHCELDAAWDRLRHGLAGVVAGTTKDLENAVVADFIASYQTHIALENAQLLPLSQQLLSADQTQRLGRAMSARRGVVYPVE